MGLRAKSVEQKAEIINRLMKLWSKQKHLRLSQLIINVYEDDFYNVEDYSFIRRLEEFYKIGG